MENKWNCIRFVFFNDLLRKFIFKACWKMVSVQSTSSLPNNRTEYWNAMYMIKQFMIWEHAIFQTSINSYNPHSYWLNLLSFSSNICLRPWGPPPPQPLPIMPHGWSSSIHSFSSWLVADRPGARGGQPSWKGYQFSCTQQVSTYDP